MVRRTLEIFFRRPMSLLILIVTLPSISSAIAYNQPRSYQASADLWALRSYSIISATGLDFNPGAAPADTQAATLSELLQIRVFAVAVAKATYLPSTFNSNVRSDPQSLADALVNSIHGVQVQSLGANLFTITYINNDPRLAQEVVAAVIQTYGSQSQGLATFEGERLLEAYQTQLVNAKQEVDAAAAAEAQYLAAHPALADAVLHSDPTHGASIDPHFALLYLRAQQAQAAVQSIQSSITSLNQSISLQGSSADDLFRVLDPPAVQHVSRTKQLLIGGGTGLGIAILASTLYLAFLVRRNRGVYTPLELQKVTTYPVAMELPHLTRATVAMLVRSTQ